MMVGVDVGCSMDWVANVVVGPTHQLEEDKNNQLANSVKHHYVEHQILHFAVAFV